MSKEPIVLTAAEAEKLVGSLSKTDKMPWYSYGLPVAACKTGAKLSKQPGTVCARCYARRGRYCFPNVVGFQLKHLASLKNRAWANAMIVLLKSKSRGRLRHFRWHDCGDLQSLRHFEDVIYIAQNVPNVQFYLPTKEHTLVRSYLEQTQVARLPLPPNLLIRFCTHRFDEFPAGTPITGEPTVKWAGVLSQAKAGPKIKGVFMCPATTVRKRCEDCRACWSQDVRNVVYLEH